MSLEMRIFARELPTRRQTKHAQLENQIYFVPRRTHTMLCLCMLYHHTAHDPSALVCRARIMYVSTIYVDMWKRLVCNSMLQNLRIHSV